MQLEALADFFTNLSRSLTSGIPLAKALSRPIRSGPDEVRTLQQEALRGLERGERLVDAMANGTVFLPRFVLPLVEAGERSGDLPAAFARIARQCKIEHRLTERLNQQLVSTALSAIGWGAFAAFSAMLLAYVSGGNAAFGDGSTPGAYAAVAGGGVLMVMLLVLRFESMRDAIFRRTPLLAPVWREARWLRFYHALGDLMAAGIPAEGALERAIDIAADPAFARRHELVVSVLRTSGLTEACAALPGIAPEALEALAVAEEAGRMPEALADLGALAEKRLDEAVARFERRARLLTRAAALAIIGVFTAQRVLQIAAPILDFAQ